VADVIQATDAVLAEAEAAGDDARAAVGAGPQGLGAGTFLRVRLDRLAVAASSAIAAARAGDSGQLRSQLHRFDVLTAAIWTVQQAVYGPPREGPFGRVSGYCGPIVCPPGLVS